MAAELTSPIRFDQQALADLHAALVETFNGEFQFWLQGDHWHRLTGDGVSDHVLSETADEAEFHLLLTEAAHTKSPVTAATNGGVLLAIPIPRASRKALVAVRTFESGDIECLQKLAELFQRDLRSQAELTSLRHEHQAFLRQVTNDFEELTFLRSMAELLEISDLSFDFTAMAETVLPTLKPLLEADGLVLVVAEKQAAGEVESPVRVGLPSVWAGSRCIDPRDCQRLVEHYHDQCEIQPIVKNNFDGTAEAQDFPGVNSFIIVPIVNGAELIGWLVALNRNNERNINTGGEVPWELSYLEFGTHEATLMSSSAAILATHARNVELFREREELLVSVVRALVSAVEAKDEYTRGHSERVALYGKRLAEELGLGEDYCERLYLTGLLHDIGKIGVRDAVLRKPDALTDAEFEEIKQHPDKGWAILQDLEALNYVLPGVLHHHESLDGRGYPDGLAGHQIPLDGRILAVADAFDAMTSDRPYRNGMPLERAEAILKDGAGKQWDADMIEAFFRALPDILDIKRTYQLRVQPSRQASQLV
ncbi:MAG: HD-GYP domain-containing protein [Planctomycetota bacterium]|nr:HD-GYP domain-containing protein [Planctomycetota bacterium]